MVKCKAEVVPAQQACPSAAGCQGAAQAQLAALLLEMSGYRAVAVDSAPKAGLSCLHCGHFLREPVQTEEGLRVCKACFAEIKRYVLGHMKEVTLAAASQGSWAMPTPGTQSESGDQIW